MYVAGMPSAAEVGLVKSQPSGRSIGGNFAWAAFGNVAFAGCQWAMLAILAKLGDPETVGKFALGLALTAPIVMFSNLHLQAVIRTDTRREYQLGHYLGLRTVTTGLAILAIAVAVFVIGYPRETALVILAVGLAKSVDSISDVVKGFLQLNERMDRVSQSLLLRGSSSVIALGIVVAATGSIFFGAVALIVASSVCLAGFDLRMARKVARASNAPGPRSAPTGTSIRPLWDRHQLKKLAWMSLPLGVGALLSSLSTNAPRYAVERRLGESDLGVYAAMAYMMIAAMMIMQALGESASPRLARRYDLGDLEGFRSLLLKLVGFGAVCGLLGIVTSALVGHTLLGVMYTDEFAQQSNVLTLLAIAASFNFVSLFLLYGLIAAQRFRAQVPQGIVVLTITFVGSYLLVPHFGLEGAAYAQMLAGLVGVAILVVLNFGVFREMSKPAQLQEAAQA
jgi:O-antigen/teichoic acid export membrane protein